MKKVCIPLCLLLLMSCAGKPQDNRHTTPDIRNMIQCDIGKLADFHKHDRYYLVEKDIEAVWTTYSEISPPAIWHGPLATFNSMYSPLLKTMYYADGSEIPEVSVGQIIMLNLLIDDYIHMPVFFQIKTMDSAEKMISFVYMEQNVSHGKQEISLYPVTFEGRTCTMIHHKSWYKSNSSIRDTLFYGHYHTLIVDEFHQSISESSNYAVKPVTEKYLKRKELINQA